MKRLALVSAFVSLVLVGGAAHPALAFVIDFEGLPNGPHGGGELAAFGVTFTTGTIPNAVAVGDMITFAVASALFDVLNPNICAISGTACALAHGGGTNDLLMSFAPSVSSVSLTSDDAPGEVLDVIRLLALAPTGLPDQFTVLAIAEGPDDGTTPAGNLLTITNGGAPFSHALFQTTTEQEGFDDLTFRQVSEPGTLLLLASGLAAFGLSRRVRRKH